jgi:hypothetical protein
MSTTMQDALSKIMELCETNMKENDYLIVTGQLKFIYDENKKKIVNKVVKVNRILSDELLRAHPTATFELTNDEKKTIMDNRLKLQYKDIIENIVMEIGNVKEEIVEIQKAKKEAWLWVKTMRYSFSPDRENSVYAHKDFVQREKDLKNELIDLNKELRTVTSLM